MGSAPMDLMRLTHSVNWDLEGILRSYAPPPMRMIFNPAARLAFQTTSRGFIQILLPTNRGLMLP